MDNYSEKCDVFSVGVILFVMLTNEMPFRGAVCKTNDSNKQYVLDQIYKLFCEKNRKFWVRYVKMSPHIQDSAKNLIYLMLKPNPQHRISIQEIINDPFYNTNTLGDEQLQETIELLKLQSMSKNRIHYSQYQRNNNNNSLMIKYANSIDNSNDETKQEIEEKKWTIDAIPFWIDEDDEFYYTTTNFKSIVDTLSQYVKTVLNGSCRFHKKSVQTKVLLRYLLQIIKLVKISKHHLF